MRSSSVFSRVVLAAALLGSSVVYAAPETLSFTTFNIRWYGLNGQMSGRLGNEKRDQTIRQHLKDNKLLTDVIAFQEVVDVERLATNVLNNAYSCRSYDHDNARHQHVVVCVRQGLKFERASNDDNFILEEVALGDHRPAVHGIVKDNRGKALVHVVSVHLKARPEFTNKRLEQAQHIANYLQHDDAALPIVMLGDFNVFESDPNDIQNIFDTMNLGLNQLEVAEDNTYRTLRYSGKLDRIWVRGMETVVEPQVYGPCNVERSQGDQISRFNREVSDHCPVSFTLGRAH